MRNLCTIQTIKGIEPIPGKDRIVLLSFVNTGWKVIGGVDSKVGDKVIYCEVDTILPIRPEFEFLRSRCFNAKWNGFRIKCMKMGGVFSEGLALPLTVLSEDFPDGKDVTSLIGAIKYDPELLEEKENAQQKKHKYPWFLKLMFHIPAFKQWYMERTKMGWPKFISKTDETRVQVLPYLFEDKWKNLPIYITEKADGQSATYALNDGVFYVCSRNILLSKSKVRNNKLYGDAQTKYLLTAKIFDIKNKLMKYKKDTGHNIYIQGEQLGPGIQGNKYGLPGLAFYVFNVYDITAKRYFSFLETKNFCIEYGFNMVPILAETTFYFTMDELIEMSKGESKLCKGVPREGIVIRAKNPLPPENGMANMFSFKVINPDFMIKYGA